MIFLFDMNMGRELNFEGILLILKTFSCYIQSLFLIRLPVVVDLLLAFVVVPVVPHARTPLHQGLSTPSSCSWEQSCLLLCLPLVSLIS